MQYARHSAWHAINSQQMGAIIAIIIAEVGYQKNIIPFSYTDYREKEYDK